MWINIILVIIVVLGVGYLYLTKRAKKLKDKALNSVKSRFSGKDLSEKEKRGLAYGAIMANSFMEDPISIMPSYGLKGHFFMLSKTLGINSSKDAKEVLEGLLNLDTSKDLDKEIAEGSNKVKETYKLIANKLKVPIEEIEKVKSTYAWDIGRASALAKWCFWTEYITEEEMFNYLDRCVEIATANGNDWTDFTYSFLIGRRLNGFELKELINYAKDILDPNTKDKNAKIYQIIAFK